MIVNIFLINPERKSFTIVDFSLDESCYLRKFYPTKICMFQREHVLGTVARVSGVVSSRIWFVSFVPTWWSTTTNSAVIAIGAIAVIDQLIAGRINVARLVFVSQSYFLCYIWNLYLIFGFVIFKRWHFLCQIS